MWAVISAHRLLKPLCIRIFSTDKERSLVNWRSTLAETYSVRRVLADTDELYGAVGWQAATASQANGERLGLPNEEYIVHSASCSTQHSSSGCIRCDGTKGSFLFRCLFYFRERRTSVQLIRACHLEQQLTMCQISDIKSPLMPCAIIFLAALLTSYQVHKYISKMAIC